ncbi:hypothetical protein ACFLXT_03520 [Chloroflexota bacterium]
MLEELFPVQFIEGINENVKNIKNELLQINTYDYVATQFVPAHTFLLTESEIYLAWDAFSQREEYIVRLYSDYKDKPTEIILREGKLVFDTSPSGYGWCKISLNEPIVIFAKNKYWLCLKSRDALFSLLQAKEGKESSFREYTDGGWLGNVLDKYRVMIKFYGRVFPVSS